MVDLKPQVTLPDWAFRALAQNAVDALIDRTEHEIIIMTRRGKPELVMMSAEMWRHIKDSGSS
jgi:hypothetical protein